AGKMMAVIMASLNSKENPITADKFNTAFQEKVSPDQVKALCAQVVDQHGSCSVVRIDRNIPPDRLVVTVAGTKTGGRFQIALGQAVVDGKIKWDDQLPIKTEYKSLPTGTLQAQPEGKTFAVSEYADNMISISDNTATDHLIHHLGRMAVEEYMKSLHDKPEV